MNVIISLGGSLIVPEHIEVEFLKKFRELILNYTSKGNKIAIIAGGGHTAGKYMESAKQIVPDANDKDLDWIGIAATKINAELVRTIFADEAYEEVFVNPTAPLKTDKKILIGCGWQPGCSSDMDAVLLAENLGTKTIINLSNIEYVYDKDPKKHDGAKPLEKISWDEMIKIVGTKWTPRMNAPFDPTATKKAKDLGLKVIIARGTDLDNFNKILEEKEFKGTTIE